MTSPLSLSVNGSATLYHRAERAIVSIKVHSEGPSQQEVSKHVTDRSNELRTELKSMALKDTNGHPAPEAAITHWSMKSLTTSNHVPRSRDGKELDRQYAALTRFSVRFKDFAELGSFASMAATTAHVSIEQVSWEITDATKAGLGSKSRHAAIKNALAQLRDYAAALGRGDVTVTEISAGSYGVAQNQHYSSHGHAAARMAAGGGGGDELNFEPENVSYSCSVQVKGRAE